MSYRDIAKAAGVSHGLVQQYFGTRQHMIAAIIQNEIEEAGKAGGRGGSWPCRPNTGRATASAEMLNALFMQMQSLRVCSTTDDAQKVFAAAHGELPSLIT